VLVLHQLLLVQLLQIRVPLPLLLQMLLRRLL
jgi:hypothetical protein